VRPTVDLDATYFDRSGTIETGGGAAHLVVRGSDDVVLSASPAVELGGELRFANGAIARPFIRAGVTVLDRSDFGVRASFAEAPAAVAPFEVHAKIDGVFADVAAGVDLLVGEGFALRLQYDGQLGETTHRHAGGIKGAVRF
jgi:outer membrane autotransporter protein